MNKRLRFILLLLWGLGVVACGSNESKRKEESIVSTPLGANAEKNYLLSEDEYLDEAEACSIARPGDCIRPPNMGTKAISICGYDLVVPVVSVLACQGVINTLPAGCTAGSVLTAGSLCTINMVLVSEICGLAKDSVTAAAECCRKGGCS